MRSSVRSHDGFIAGAHPGSNHLVKWVALIFFGAVTPGPAEISSLDLPAPPPQAVAAEIAVERGGVVAIRLRVAGITQSAEFRIRDRPVYGKLSEPAKVDETSAVVRYRHGNGETETQDAFSYSVRSSAGLSAPAEITIRIFDPPARFVAPSEIPFGDVIVGERKALALVLENRGGGVVTGTAETGVGWRIEGDPAYRLKARERQTLTIVCEAGRAGNLSGSVTYSSEPGRVTELHGTGIVPLRVSPADLELVPAGSTGERRGALAVESCASEPLRVAVARDERLLGPDDVLLEPGGRATIELALAATDPLAYRGQVAIACRPAAGGGGVGAEPYRVNVPVRAAHLGAALRWTAAKLEFPAVETGRAVRAEGEIENLGLDRATVRLTPPDRVRVIGEPTFALAGGEKRRIGFEWTPAEKGQLRAFVGLQWDGGESRLELGGLARPGAGAAAPAVELGVRPGLPPKPGPKMVERIEIRSLTPGTLVLGWPEVAGARVADDGYRVEYRKLSLKDRKKLKIDWAPVPEIKIARERGEARATITGIEPRSVYTLRIITLGDDGRQAVSPPFQVLVPGPPGRRAPGGWPLLGGGFAVVAAGLGVFYWWWRWRRRMEEEAAADDDLPTAHL